MAVVPSDLKFCLMWETERPYIGRERRSSCFRMLGDEWYIRLSLQNHGAKNYACYMYLNRLDGVKWFESAIAAKCLIITDVQIFNDYYGSHTFQKAGSDTLIFRNWPDISKLSPNESSGNWKIICHLSYAKPLFLQTNNETLLLSTGQDVDHSSKSTDRCVQTDYSTKSTDRCVQASPEVPQDIESLSSAFSSLLEDDAFADFELQCGNCSFRVHRSILAARSEVFRTMFQSCMMERESGSADIKDLEAPILQTLLKFIYSGKLEQVSDDTMSKIYEASDRYAVHCLKTACCDWMKKNLTDENCVNFLDIADSHCDHDLKAAVVSFVIENPRVFRSPAWLTYSKAHHEMANEVLQTYVSTIIQ